jgi:hypothetical protein
MTFAEILTEVMAMDTGETYAGGMTAGDIEDIKAESAALRERIAKKKAQANGTSTN